MDQVVIYSLSSAGRGEVLHQTEPEKSIELSNQPAAQAEQQTEQKSEQKPAQQIEQILAQQPDEQAVRQTEQGFAQQTTIQSIPQSTSQPLPEPLPQPAQQIVQQPAQAQAIVSAEPKIVMQSISIEELATAIASALSRIKVYVVESEITAAQQAVRAVVERSHF